MNARQKAKKFKKELDFYKNMPMPVCKVYYDNLKRYRVKHTVKTDCLYIMSTAAESPLTYINKAIAGELAENILNDIEFTLEPSIIPEHTDITGEIAIVTRKGKVNE